MFIMKKGLLFSFFIGHWILLERNYFFFFFFGFLKLTRRRDKEEEGMDF
jgi:hypothetical protein